MNYKNITPKYIWLFSLLFLFTNCKNETVTTNQIKIKQTSLILSTSDKEAIEYYRNEQQTLHPPEKRLIA